MKFWAILILAILVLGFASIYSNIFLTPLNFIDEGQFLSWVTNMSSGKSMFKQIYITYGPLYVYLYYILINFFSLNILQLRIAFAVINVLLGCSVIFLILMSLRVEKKISIAASAYSLLLIPLYSIRQSAGLMAIYFLILSLESQQKSLSILTGILILISILISPEIGIYTLLVSITVYLLKLIVDKNVKDNLEKAIFIFVGFCGFLLLLFSTSFFGDWFLDYTKVTLDVFNSLGGELSPIGKDFPRLFEILNSENKIYGLLSQRALILWVLIFNIILIIVNLIFFVEMKFNINHQKFFAVSLFAIFISTTLIGRNGFGHVYFVLPAITIPIFFFINLLYKKSKKQALDVILILILTFFLVRFVSINRPTILRIFTLNTEKATARIEGVIVENYRLEDIRGLSEFVSNNIEKNEPVFFLKDEPAMYYLIQRRNATSFDLPFIASAIDKRYKMLDELKQSQVKYLFENNNSWDVDEIENRERLPEIDNYINKNFVKCERIGSIQIYCRK